MSGRRRSSAAGGGAGMEIDMNKLRRRRASAFIVPKEGGWGWLVCVASLWTNGTIFGIINSFGVMYEHIVENIDGATNFKTSWAASLCSGLTFMLSPLSSIITDRIGCRAAGLIGGSLACGGMVASSFVTRIELLFVTYGIMVGAGFSIAYTPSLVILGRYFRKKIGMANGIVTFGSGVFTIVLPIGLKLILESVGLPNTLRVMAGLCAVMTIGAIVFRPVPLPSNVDAKILEDLAESAPHGKPALRNLYGLLDLLDVSVWKKRNYRIWAIGVPVAVLGYFVPFVHLVKHVNQLQLNKNAAILITCIGATSGLARLVFGHIIDSPRINRISLQQISFLVIGVVTTLLPVVRNFYALCVMMSIMGVFDGCFVLLIGPIALDLAGPEDSSKALGFLFFMMSFPMTAGPPIAGYMYDKLQTYNGAFLLAGVPPIVGACILFLIRQDDADEGDPTASPEESLEEEVEQGMTLLNGSEEAVIPASPRCPILSGNEGVRAVENPVVITPLPPPVTSRPSILSTPNRTPNRDLSPAFFADDDPLLVSRGVNGAMPKSGRRVTYGEVSVHDGIVQPRLLSDPRPLLVTELVTVV